MDTVPEFHAEAPQSTASKGLAQDPYVAARAGMICMVYMRVYIYMCIYVYICVYMRRELRSLRLR